MHFADLSTLQVKPHSAAGANALAKISHDLGNAYNKIREGESDPFAGVLSPPESSAGQNSLRVEIPQPHGLQGTFFRQRPRETWTQTACRVLSEDGYESLIELCETNEDAARHAAAEAIRIRKAADIIDIASLETISGTYAGTPVSHRSKSQHEQRGFDFAPMRAPIAPIQNRAPIASMQYRAPIAPMQNSGLFSPVLRADAEPFTPGGGRNMFAALDRENASSGYQPPASSPKIRTPIFISPPGLSGFQARFPPQAHEMAARDTSFPHVQTHRAKTSGFAPIGHERAQLRAHQPPIQSKQRDQSSLPEHWEDVVSQDSASEDTFESSNRQASYEDKVPTPQAMKVDEGVPSPQFETSPDSPTYRTWAQKAAVGDDESGWEQVVKSKRAAHPMASKAKVSPAVISHQDARYVVVTGCRASTTLSDITAQVDTGPLVSVSMSKDPGGGLKANILFVHGSHAIDFVANNQYSLSAHGESLYGPGVKVAMGPGYGGPQSDFRGMTIPLNQAGRSDAGAHFQRRRITFSGNGLQITEGKLRSVFTKTIGLDAADIEAIIVFNPGNATAIFASVFAARKVKDQMCSKRNGEWKHCKIMYSSDPCEKHLGFMDKVRSERQADRAEVVRRAYQKAGKVNC